MLMRIWAFPFTYPYDQPGMAWNGIFAHRQYKGLIQNGADLKVIIPVPWHPPFPFSLLHNEWKSTSKLAYPAQREYDGITVYHPRIANMKPSRFVKKTYTERYVDSIINFFKDNNITLNPATDVFYSQWLPGSAMVQLAAHKLGLKSGILSIGDDVVLWPNSNEANRQLFVKTMTEADLRFSCSEYLGKLANKTLGKELPFDVVRWGVDHDWFKPVTENEKQELRKKYKLSDDKAVILNIGTAGIRKGWLDLFDALSEVKKHNPNFVLAAVYTGKTEFDFQEEVAKRELTENFVALGEFPPQSLNAIYNLADIFCLPSHSEGLANVVVEAMSSGIATITTSVGGHPELINSGVNGILVPPQQPGILAEQLLQLVNDEKLRARLGTAARQHIVTSWGNFAESTRVLYQKLCNQ
jgi:teichuronic acid biosynthesis glycosyltransferase TuaC